MCCQLGEYFVMHMETGGMNDTCYFIILLFLSFSIFCVFSDHPPPPSPGVVLEERRPPPPPVVVKPVVELIKCSLCLQKDIVPKEEIYYRVSVLSSTGLTFSASQL